MSLAVPDIQLACVSDAGAIATMSRDYVESGLIWSWVPPRVLRSIRDSDTNVAVVRARSAMIGFGIMQYGDEGAHLALLAVHPSHRNRGLGSRLLAWLEKPARVAGLTRIDLETRADNPLALQFYRSQGYRDCARIAGYYQGRIDAVKLRKPLAPAAL